MIAPLAGVLLIVLTAFILISICEAAGWAIEDDTETQDSSMTEGF